MGTELPSAEELTMATAFHATTTIAADPEQVWATLVDWEQAPTWMPGVDDARATGPTSPGARVEFTTRGRQRTSEVVAADGRVLHLRSTRGGVTADYVYTVRARHDRTTVVDLVADCRTRGAWTLAAPLLRRLLARTDGDQLAALRARIEGVATR